MSRLGSFIGFVRNYKYGIVITLAVVLVGFADDNSIWNHIQNQLTIGDMKDEIRQYNTQYNHDMSKLRALDRDPNEMEKIARERYFMKADDEDIFVLSDDE